MSGVAAWVGLWITLLAGAVAVWFLLVRRLWRQWCALLAEVERGTEHRDAVRRRVDLAQDVGSGPAAP